MSDKTETEIIVKGVAEGFDKASSEINKIGTSMVNLNQGLELAKKGFEAMKQVYDFAKEGAAVMQTSASFDKLSQSLSPNIDLMQALSDAAGGTVDELTIQSSYLTLMAGAGDELGASLSNATPQLMAIAKAANTLNPTLGDTSYMFESIATGIKRGSPLILDNLGLMVNQTSANKAYADALGKTVDELTDVEKKQALLNEVMRTGNTLIEQAGTDNAVDSYNRLESGIKDLTDTMKKNVSDGVEPMIAGLAGIVEKGNEVRESTAQLSHAVELGIITQKEMNQIYWQTAGDRDAWIAAADKYYDEIVKKEKENIDGMMRSAAVADQFAEQRGMASGVYIAAVESESEAEKESAEVIQKALEERNKAITSYNEGRLDEIAKFTDMERDYAEESAEIAQELADVQAELADKRAREYSDTNSAVQELIDKQDELIAEQGELAAAHEMATHQIILGYLEQKLAADGLLSDEETMWLIKKGVEWGIYSETAISEMQSVMNEANALYNQLNGLTANMYVVTHYSSTRNSGLAAGAMPSGYTDYINEDAAGGPAGGMTMVGEHGPELVNLPNGSYVNSNSTTNGMLVDITNALKEFSSKNTIDYNKMAGAVTEALMQVGA